MAVTATTTYDVIPGVDPKMAADLVEALAELKNAPKDGKAQYGEYAKLPTILDLVRPVLAKHGLGLTQETVTDGMFVGVVTRIYHRGGGFLRFGPLMMPAGQNAQTAGSAITYARRYALAAALGIAAEEDDDGQKASASPPSSGLVTPGGDRQGAASSSPGDVDGGSAPPKDGAPAPSGTPTPSDRVPEAAGASRTGSDTSSEPSRAASDTSGGEGRSVDGEDAADPNPSTTRRDQLWANLLDFAGSRKAAVNAVNKAVKASWTEKQIGSIPEDDLELTIRHFALQEPVA